MEPDRRSRLTSSAILFIALAEGNWTRVSLSCELKTVETAQRRRRGRKRGLRIAVSQLQRSRRRLQIQYSTGTVGQEAFLRTMVYSTVHLRSYGDNAYCTSVRLHSVLVEALLHVQMAATTKSGPIMVAVLFEHCTWYRADGCYNAACFAAPDRAAFFLLVLSDCCADINLRLEGITEDAGRFCSWGNYQRRGLSRM